jgi:hypothetical protein
MKTTSCPYCLKSFVACNKCGRDIPTLAEIDTLHGYCAECAITLFYMATSIGLNKNNKEVVDNGDS